MRLARVIGGMDMSKPKVTNSAPLHQRMTAFAGIFVIFTLHFPSAVALALAVFAVVALSKM